jgi:hypothetical protein
MCGSDFLFAACGTALLLVVFLGPIQSSGSYFPPYYPPSPPLYLILCTPPSPDRFLNCYTTLVIVTSIFCFLNVYWFVYEFSEFFRTLSYFVACPPLPKTFLSEDCNMKVYVEIHNKCLPCICLFSLWMQQHIVRRALLNCNCPIFCYVQKCPYLRFPLFFFLPYVLETAPWNFDMPGFELRDNKQIFTV